MKERNEEIEARIAELMESAEEDDAEVVEYIDEQRDKNGVYFIR